MKYIPINIKTNYELLSSLIKLDDLICFAKENNITTLGITDGSMFLTIEFYNKCIANNIKPIIGSEIKLYDKSIILYAKNYEGYKNICKIVTKRNLEELDIDFVRENSKNILGVIKPDKELFKMVSTIFNTIFISYENTEERNNALILSNNIVFSNEILCLDKKDEKFLKYLYMIRDGETISNHKEYSISNNHYLGNINEYDINTTIDFCKLLDFKLPKFDFKLPKYSENSKELLISLCKKGLNKRLNNSVSKEYSNRLLYELSVIEKMGYIDYFLIVYDYVLYAKKNNIVVGPGRGSAAGSLVSYSLGITNVDPIKFNLIFERFLNPERITMPDIDIDFEFQRRDEVVNYVRNKYGKDKVANIITFGTLLPKQVIRDVGRVLEINLKEIDKICKMIDDNVSLEDMLKKEKFKTLVLSDSNIKNLFIISRKFEGLKRHTSIHAAGVVISNETLTEKMPLYKSGENILTSFSMEYMEELGLLKMDFLALRNLSIIDSVLKLIGKSIDVNNLNLNDSKTLKIFYDVKTVGIFQFESRGMKNFLSSYKVTNFNDLVAAIALYRPGPMEMIPTYIKRKEGKEKVSYILPVLEKILVNTYGIIIYQEQIMEIFKSVSSYTYAEADNIRRAMSKKKESIILAERERFIKESIKNGNDELSSKKVYDLILKFANYGFNKAHSVAYSLIAYQMAYLKANYPNEFMVSLLNMVIGREIKIKEYLEESKILGIKFEKIDINESKEVFYINKNNVIYPFGIIKGIGYQSIKEILENRKKGLFKDIYDFIRRISPLVNKNIIELLIDSGAVSFGYNKRTLKENLDELINYANLCKDLDESLVSRPEIICYEEYDKNFLINREYELFGFYINNHPATEYERNEIRAKDINKYFDKNIEFVGLLENIRSIRTKNNDKMAFITFSDETDSIEGVLFPKIYENCPYLEKGNIIKVKAKVERRNSTYQLIINDLHVLN